MPGQPTPKNSKKSGVPQVAFPAKPATVDVSPSRDCVTLCKGQHRWTFSWAPGQEQTLLKRLAELARADDVPFDWFDAALVSHQLSHRLLPGLARNDPTPPPPSAPSQRTNPTTG